MCEHDGARIEAGPQVEAQPSSQKRSSGQGACPCSIWVLDVERKDTAGPEEAMRLLGRNFAIFWLTAAQGRPHCV